MNIIGLKIATSFQNIFYSFLQKKIEPYLLSSRLYSAVTSIPDVEKCNFYYEINNFANELEQIHELNEPIDFFSTYESKEKGWPYYHLMEAELLRFLPYLYNYVSIPVCTKKLRYDFPFLDKVGVICTKFLNNQITKDELLYKIKQYYGYWKEEISQETCAVIEYFLSAIAIIPFVPGLDESEITKKSNELINYINSAKTLLP